MELLGISKEMLRIKNEFMRISDWDSNNDPLESSALPNVLRRPRGQHINFMSCQRFIDSAIDFHLLLFSAQLLFSKIFRLGCGMMLIVFTRMRHLLVYFTCTCSTIVRVNVWVLYSYCHVRILEYSRIFHEIFLFHVPLKIPKYSSIYSHIFNKKFHNYNLF